jgi:N-acetylglucosamine kinase-like BadF-type ATPase
MKKINKRKEKKSKKIKKIKLKIYEYAWKSDPIALSIAAKSNPTSIKKDLNLIVKRNSTAFHTKKIKIKKTLP